jgi:hypothetical protein
MKGLPCTGSLAKLLIAVWFATTVGFVAAEFDPKIEATWGSISADASESLAVSDGYAYIPSGRDGVFVIDFSDLSSPKTIARLPTDGAARGIAIRSGIAYVADEFRGLVLYDIGNPTNINLLATLSLPGHPRDVVLESTHAFVATQDGGLQIVDISNPSAPKRSAGCDVPGDPARIAVGLQKAYMVGRAGMQIVDVSDVGHPFVIGLGPVSEDVVSAWGSVYAVNAHSAIRDLAQPFFPGLPPASGVIGPFQSTRHIEANTNYTCFTAGEDYQTPWIWVRTRDGETRTVFNGGAMAIDGSRLFVSGSGGRTPVFVYDLSQQAPPLICNYEVGHSVYGTAIQGDLAVLIEAKSYERSLVILDLTNPKVPIELGRISVAPTAVSVAMHGSNVCVTASSPTEFAIYDISNPVQIITLGKMQLIDGSVRVMTDKLAFSADVALRIIDISNRTLPRLVASVSVGGSPGQIAVQGGLVAMATAYQGVTFIDVSNPESPTQLSQFNPYKTLGFQPTIGVALRNNLAFVKTESKSISLTRFPQGS